MGQAIEVSSSAGLSGKPGTANIKNSIISDHIFTSSNSSALNVQINSTANLLNVWFGNNTNPTNENSKPVAPGTYILNHVWKDQRSAGFISPASPNYDYHLRSDSPVIDLASGSTTNIDLDNMPRPVGPIPDLGSYEYRTPVLRAEKPVLYAITDSKAILTLTDLISVSNGPIAEWVATTSSNWVYLGPSGTLQQTTGQTGSNLTLRLDPSKISLGTYVVTINIASNTANPTTITINIYYVAKVERTYLPNILK